MPWEDTWWGRRGIAPEGHGEAQPERSQGGNALRRKRRKPISSRGFLAPGGRSNRWPRWSSAGSRTGARSGGRGGSILLPEPPAPPEGPTPAPGRKDARSASSPSSEGSIERKGHHPNDEIGGRQQIEDAGVEASDETLPSLGCGGPAKGTLAPRRLHQEERSQGDPEHHPTNHG